MQPSCFSSESRPLKVSRLDGQFVLAQACVCGGSVLERNPSIILQTFSKHLRWRSDSDGACCWRAVSMLLAVSERRRGRHAGSQRRRVYEPVMEPGMLNVAQKVSLHHPGTHTHMENTHTHTQAEQRGCSACETCGRQTGGGLIRAGAARLLPRKLR